MVSWQLLIFGVIILSAIGTIIEKKTLFKEHAMEFSASVAFIVAIISLVFIPFLKFNFPFNYWIYIYLISLLGAIAFFLIAKSTRHMEISSSSPLFSFAPVFTAILAWIVLKEALSWNHLFGISLVFVGSYVLEMNPKKSFKKDLLLPFKTLIKSKYVHYMVLALFLYAITNIPGRFILNSANPNAVEPLTFMFVLNMFLAINTYILIKIYHDGFKGVVHGLKKSGKLIFIMALLMVSWRSLTSFAISVPSAQIALVTALRRGSILISTFFGGEIFKDKHLKQKTIASLIMVIGAVMVIF